MAELPNDAGPEDREGPSIPEPGIKGRRRLVIPEAGGEEGFIATLDPAERAEFLSHHYKLQQVEQLAGAEAQAFRGCAWRGGFFCAGLTLAMASEYLLERARIVLAAPEWVQSIVFLFGMVGTVLIFVFLVPAILGFLRWVVAMRDRRRRGRVVVMAAADFKGDKAGKKDQDGGL
jgi:hypothetical protein